MYVKFRIFHPNLLQISKFSPKVRHQNDEKFLYVRKIPKEKFQNVRKIPLEINSSYTLKPSCEPLGFSFKYAITSVNKHSLPQVTTLITIIRVEYFTTAMVGKR